MNHHASLFASAVLLFAGTAFAGNNLDVPTDFTTIQAAVDVAQFGDTVVVGEGRYLEQVVVKTSGITLRSRGAVIDAAYAGNCLDIQADQVTVIGFKLVNGGTPGLAGAEGTGGGLSYIGDRATIIDCDVSASANYGISLTGRGEIKSCLVSACLGTGLVVDAPDQQGDLILVIGNQVVRNGAGIVANDGPFLFFHNVISHNIGDGIHLTILGGAADGLVPLTTEISNNDMIGNGGTGLYVLDEIGGVRLIEKGDIEMNTLGMDITGTGLTMRDIDVMLNRAGGIHLKTTFAALDRNNISRNTLFGIVISAPEGVADGGNTFSDNKVLINGGDGVHVTSGLNYLRHNVMRDNLGDGIQVASGTANVILENVVRDSAHDGIDNWGLLTYLENNFSEGSGGADIAGIGDGNGTVDPTSFGNVANDHTGVTVAQELELDTLP